MKKNETIPLYILLYKIVIVERQFHLHSLGEYFIGSLIENLFFLKPAI